MTIESRPIPLSFLPLYVDAAILDDGGIVDYYDKAVPVASAKEASENISSKILAHYPDAEAVGFDIAGEKAGYLVREDDSLVSFGLAPKFRQRQWLCPFWEAIKEEMGGPFRCLLYAYNSRAVNFLIKGGMEVVLDTVTALQYNPIKTKKNASC